MMDLNLSPNHIPVLPLLPSQDFLVWSQGHLSLPVSGHCSYKPGGGGSCSMRVRVCIHSRISDMRQHSRGTAVGSSAHLPTLGILYHGPNNRRQVWPYSCPEFSSFVGLILPAPFISSCSVCRPIDDAHLSSRMTHSFFLY